MSLAAIALYYVLKGGYEWMYCSSSNKTEWFVRGVFGIARQWSVCRERKREIME